MARAATVTESAVAEFKTAFGGEVIQPDDDGYDAARTVWNAGIDRRPAVIARCSGVADVIAAVEFARQADLPLAVRGGGHNIAGFAVCDGGIVVDQSLMSGVRVDSRAQTVRAGGGATWGKLDRETQVFGLATTGGLISTTGIGGLTLGGGLGWLMGKHGLSCDNLLSVDVVTAEGESLTANATENADLFWALRGGGGNFGVVTSFEYQLHAVGEVVGGLVAHPVANAAEVLRFYRDYTASAPDELTVFAGLTCLPDGTPAAAIRLCYAGLAAEANAVVGPAKKFGSPLADHIGPLPYRQLQGMLDASAPPGRHNYWKSDYLNDLSDAAIDTLIEHYATCSSPNTLVLLEHFHGAVSRVAADATAFPHRAPGYNLNIASTWTDPAETDAQIAWTREFAEAMRPFTRGDVYMNYVRADEGADRIRAAYGSNYERLSELKRKYDPNNLFRLNANITPAR